MAIRWDKLTVKAQEAMQRANDLASEHGNPELQPVHILAALLEDRELSRFAACWSARIVHIATVQNQVMSEIEKLLKAWRSASSPATFPNSSRTSAWYRLTWARCWRARNIVASSKTA